MGHLQKDALEGHGWGVSFGTDEVCIQAMEESGLLGKFGMQLDAEIIDVVHRVFFDALFELF